MFRIADTGRVSAAFTCRSTLMQDRTLLAFAGLLSQRVQLLAGAVRHEKKPQEYHLVVSAVQAVHECSPCSATTDDHAFQKVISCQ